jgi:hypothetical protein
MNLSRYFKIAYFFKLSLFEKLDFSFLVFKIFKLFGKNIISGIGSLFLHLLRYN